MIYILRWKDLEGNEHTKEYTDQLKVYKAAKWLRDGGAKDVDIAIKL